MLFREGERVELKETYVDDIRKEIIAFANSNGGTIYIGVRDDGEVVGLDDPDGTTLRISNGCRDAIRPDITMFLSYRLLEPEAKPVLEVQVQRGTARPYYLEAKGLRPSGVYVRQGSYSAPASAEAIRRMIKETDGDEFEAMRSLEQALTFEEAGRSFSERGIEFGEPQLRTLGLINSEGIYTDLALLLSDQCPHIIKAATFQGTTQAVFRDRREFSGSLLKQLREAYEYLDLRNRTKATFRGLLRTDRRDYSEAALREALLNAIVHRDYSNPAPTLIGIYTDRVEFVSYGGLAGGVTLEDVLCGLSVCRNRRLAEVFYRLRLIEAYGTGLKRIREAYADTSAAPEFTAGPSSFRVVLPNVNELPPCIAGSECDPNEERVLRYIGEHGRASRAELQAGLGLSASTVVRLIRQLRDSGRLRTIGSGRNTAYERRE